MKRASLISMLCVFNITACILLINSCTKVEQNNNNTNLCTQTCVHGSLTSTTSNCTCNCSTGYKGAKCDSLITTDPCATTVCHHGGTAVATSSSTCACNCPNGFAGPTCDSAITPCTPLNCLNGGTQVTHNSVCSCNCPAFTFGQLCQSYSSLFLTAGNAATWTITGEVDNGTPVNFTNPNMVFSSVSGMLNKVSITNFYGFSSGSAQLTVTDSLGTLTSGTDTISYTDNGSTFKIYEYHGVLNAAKTIVNYTYTIRSSGNTETAVGTLVKQ